MALASGRVEARQSLDKFKLGLGGEVLVFPGPYDASFHPLLGAAVRRLARKRNACVPWSTEYWVAVGRARALALCHPDDPPPRCQPREFGRGRSWSGASHDIEGS
jgi:hypothetical protein